MVDIKYDTRRLAVYVNLSIGVALSVVFHSDNKVWKDFCRQRWCSKSVTAEEMVNFGT